MTQRNEPRIPLDTRPRALAGTADGKCIGSDAQRRNGAYGDDGDGQHDDS